MEKYRSYADEATGCQPFVPTFYSQKQLRSYASGSPIVCCILGCIAFPFKIVMLLVALVRVLALVISLLLAGLLLILIFPFKLSPYLHWFLKRLVLRLPLWIVMIAFGFNRVIEEPADYRRLKIKQPLMRRHPYSSFLWLTASPLPSPQQSSAVGSPRNPSRVALCFSSFTSFAEVLYLQMRLNPQFVGLHGDGSLSVLGFWDALKYSFSFELLPGRGPYLSLSALLTALERDSSSGSGSNVSNSNTGKSNNSNGGFVPPLVVFPEGQKSNGLCLLQWDNKAFDNAALNRLRGRIALVGYQYSSDGKSKTLSMVQAALGNPPYTPPHTVNSPLRHLLLLLLEPRQCMRCIWVPPEDVLTSLQQQALLQTEQQLQVMPQQSQQQQQSELESLRNILMRSVPGLVGVSRQGRDLKAFNDYWNQQRDQSSSSCFRIS